MLAIGTLAMTACSIVGASALEQGIRGGGEWEQPELHDSFDVTPRPGTTLIGIRAEEHYDGSVRVDDSDIRGACDPDCGTATEDVITLVRDADIVPTLSEGVCGSCSYGNALVIVEVNADGVRVVPRGEVVELIIPIDTPYEALIAHRSIPTVGRFERLRIQGDGWEIVTGQRWECWPADTRYWLWTLEADGTQRETDSLLRRASSSEPEVCA